MPAAGENNTAGIAAAVQAGEKVYILITDQYGEATATALAGGEPAAAWTPAQRKTKVVTALVTGAEAVMTRGSGRRQSRRYTLQTDRGPVANLAPIETLWLGKAPAEPTPQPAAGEPDAAAEDAGKPLQVTSAVEVSERQRQRRVDMWTGRFMAETVSAEPSRYVEPIDEALEDAFAGTNAFRDGDVIANKVRPLYPAIRAEFHRLVGQIPGYYWSSVRKGDVVRLTGETDTHTVTDAWWVSDLQTHKLILDDGRELAERSEDLPRLTLVERPGWGPLNHVYRVGDRVGIIGNGIPERELTGVVAEVIEVPGEGIVGYDVQTATGGKIPVGVDRMRPDSTPMPAAGQRWISTTGRVATVRGIAKDYPSGLVAETDLTHSVILAAPHWRPLTDTEAAELDAVAAAEADTHGDGPAEPEAAPAEPDPKLIDAILRYGGADAVAGMARIDAILSDPVVAAIRERVGKLTEGERARLHEVGMRQFSENRIAMSRVRNRVAKHDANWRDYLMAADQASSDLDAVLVGDGSDNFAAHAVADAVWASAVQAHLDADEYRLFAKPWLTVAVPAAA